MLKYPVSLVFQRNAVTVSDVKHELDRADLALQNMTRREGRHLQSFQDEVGDGRSFQNVILQRGERDSDTFARKRVDILSDSIYFLQQRFQHFGGPLLNVAAMITDHNSWPRERDELGLHGEQDIEAVATHYKNVLQRNNFDINDAKDQWLSLKVHGPQHKSHGQPQSAGILATNVHSTLK